MRSVFPAMFAEFFELDFPLDGFFVFARVIIPICANGALEPY